MRYIESCLALYDLRIDWQYYDKNMGYNYYFFDQPVNGLNIKIRSDGYYIFDFIKSNIGKPVKHESIICTNYVRNERVETIHAFLACLRYSAQKKYGQYHNQDMDFLDNFIICSKEKTDLDQIIKYDNNFSTKDYWHLCNEKLERIKKSENNFTVDNTEIIQNAISIMAEIMKIDHNAIYILGIFYRSAVYHKLCLDLHTVLFLRSIFEWLVRRKLPRRPNEEDYKKFLNEHEIINNDYSTMMKLKDLREFASHELKYPKTNFINNPISKSFQILQKIFCTEFNIKVSIPFGQGSMNILEDY